MRISTKIAALTVAIATIELGACSALQNLAGNSPAANDALIGVQAVLTTYADVFQPAIITYGRLPVCPNPTPSGTVCHDPAVLAKMKAADAAATKAIVSAQAVLEGSTADAGQITAAMQAVAAAEATISAATALKGN